MFKERAQVKFIRYNYVRISETVIKVSLLVFLTIFKTNLSNQIKTTPTGLILKGPYCQRTQQLCDKKNYILASQNPFGLGTLFPRSNTFRQPAWHHLEKFLGLEILYEALHDTVYVLMPPRLKNYCTTFCICWTPTHRLEMTATDPAFRWCRLLVLVLLLSQRKCGVCPKKVDEMAFFGCSEFHWTKFT